MRKKVRIVNKLGIHARAASKFVTCAMRFQSDLRVCCGAKSTDGKSIMGMMLLAAEYGAELDLIAEGADASDMLKALAELIRNRFGESE